MPRISESRVALVISLLAVLATGWQGFEARKANSFANESIRIQIQRELGKSPFLVVRCASDMDEGFTLVTYFTFKIFNLSVQPVTIDTLLTHLHPPEGSWSSLHFDRDFSEPISPKGVKVITLPFSIKPSPEFQKWYVGIGGCEKNWGEKVSWIDVARKAGFNSVGWPTGTRIKVSARLTSGSGVSIETVEEF